MGTPALLTITDEYGEQVFYRRHYDGYPSHVMPNLAPVLERIRAVGSNDSYGLRISDVAALVAWVGVEEERAYAKDRVDIGLPNFGKMSTWLQIDEEFAHRGYFSHYYVLDLETLSLYEFMNA